MNMPKVKPAEVIAMYEKGYTTSEIAERYGVSRSHVRKTLSDTGKYQPENGVDKGKVRALWKAGWSIQKIMYDCECTEAEAREIIYGKADRT